MPLLSRSTVVVAVAAVVISACSDPVNAPTPVESGPTQMTLAKDGSGGGGGTPTPVIPNPLPQTPPAPGVLVFESFGKAAGYRPHGGKGDMRVPDLHVTIGGFWVEYPGSKATQWKVPNGDQTWKFAGCTENPNQMPSTIDLAPEFGCTSSEWFDAVTQFPTALMPFTAPATAYTLSADGWAAPIDTAYLAIGFTSSPALLSNLTTSGLLWLRMKEDVTDGSIHYELRTNGMTGPVLASGEAGFRGFCPMSLRYDPVARTVTLSIDGLDLGTYPVTIPVPKYVAFEGIGILDNVVVRK
jgi:hypothetical protein